MKRILGIGAITAALLVAAPALAADTGSDGAFQFRVGWFFPAGNGSFWDANEQAFTLSHSDFNGPIGGVGYVGAINNYLEFGVGVDVYQQSQRSADRFFTDQNGFPILHDSRLSLVPVSADFRVLPLGRYNQRGHDSRYRARHPVLYLGGGIGLEYWQYEEEGDFVANDINNTIFYDRLTDSGVEFEKHLMLGVELPVSPRWNMTFEARQSWAKAKPGGQFTGINDGRLDLGGTSVYFGGALRF
jgi:hypothetical protein